MRTYPLAITSLISLYLAGCATDPATLAAYKEMQMSQKPTLEVTCPAGGCSVAYRDPRDSNNMRLPTNGYDVLNTAIATTGQVFGSAIVPAAFAIAATKGFAALKGSGQVTTNTTTTTTTTTDNHAVDSTHVPTIVTQPAPTIVQNPAPVVVQIPAAQVVNPVVVNPVIVGP